MRKVRLVALALVAVLVVFVAHLAWLRLSSNFHPVVEGEVYRSAQMEGRDLARWKRQFGIATVLNLRGAKPGADWYEAERGTADRLGIRHIDYKMSASDMLSPERMHELIGIMRDAPKPLLIHCLGGADRTGLASALYLAAVAGRPEREAEAQLSVAYGHIGLPWVSSAWPMDQSWEAAEASLGFSGS